jgi:hypothetical protein
MAAQAPFGQAHRVFDTRKKRRVNAACRAFGSLAGAKTLIAPLN